MKPRIFLSEVIGEFETTRQRVANVLTRLGYEPVLKNTFGNEHGDLRPMLRQMIDGCDGLIQIVGDSYGSEPPTVEPDIGRVSYTQFEFLYARQRGKKTWLIFAGNGCTRDKPLDQLDLPADPATPHSAAYQAERRQWQTAWRERWKRSEHEWYEAQNDRALDQHIHGIRFRRFRFAHAAVLLMVLVLFGWIGWRQWFGDRAVVATVQQQLAAMKPERIKAQLRSTIEKTYQRDFARAETLTDWQKRDEARQSARETRDQRLGQVDEFLASITREIESGMASPEFIELTRIVQEQGVDPALADIASQASRLLGAADRLTREKRRTLAPLLKGVWLQRTKGELDAALAQCEKLIAQDGDWPELLHEHCWTRIDRGDEAANYKTVADTLTDFVAAETSAKRSLAAQPSDPVRLRDYSVCLHRLGDVFLKLGRTGDAITRYEFLHAICHALAETDLGDAQKQRGLSISYERLGDVVVTLGRTDNSLAQLEDGSQIRRAPAEADPSDAQKQRGLSATYGRLGDVFLKLGRTDDALKFANRKFEISKALAEADPRSAENQRDLMVSHYKLGRVQVELGQYDEAITRFQSGIAVLARMIANGQNVQQPEEEKARFEERIAFCQLAKRVTGEWESVVKLDAADLPIALITRAMLLAKRGQVKEVEQAAEKLRELEPKTADNLYKAACAYALALTAFRKDKPEPTAAQQASQRKLLDLSLACMKESLAAGFDDFDHLRQEPNLTPLRSLPEFEALIPTRK